MEFLRLLGNVAWSATKGIFGAIFFFWPLKYKDIANDVVLITGGGRGIGRLIATEFANRRPKQIILWGRHEDTLSATAKAIELKGVRCDYMVCDVSNRKQIQYMAKEVLQNYGSVDILVNNAGVVSGTTILDSHPDDIENTIRVNLLAHFWTVKEFLPGMMSLNHGHIVSINSVLGLMGLAGAADYCASKFGALGFFESLRMEISREGKDGIHLTTIHPYQIDTEMFDGVKPRFPSLFPPLDKHYVAWKIVNAVCTNQDFCIMPRMMYFSAFLNQVLPVETILHMQRFLHLDRVMDTFRGRRTSSQQNISPSSVK